MLPEIALSASIVALAAAVLSVLISLGTALRIRELERPREVEEGLAPGAQIPATAMQALHAHRADAPIDDDPTLVVFVSAGCRPCQDLIEQLSSSPSRVQGHRLVFVQPSDADPSLRERAKFSADWLTDSSGVLWDAFRTRGTPSSFLIRDGRLIRRRLGADISDLLHLLDTLNHEGAKAPTTNTPVSVGGPA